MMRPGLTVAIPWLACTAALADPRGIGEAPPPLTPELLEARRMQLADDMAGWLPRLVGRFKVDGIADFNAEPTSPRVSAASEVSGSDSGAGDGGEEGDDASPAVTESGNPVDPLKLKPASGRADCVAVGNGPGVHCLFNVTWLPEWTAMGEPVDGGDPFLAPAMKLFGFEPNTPLIHQLQLDTDGVAELESTTLKGNTIRWIYPTRCESDTRADELCRRVTRFYAPVGANRVQLAIEFEKWDHRLQKWRPQSAFMLDLRRELDDEMVSRSEATVPAGQR
jgi:hypothetical protein